MNVHFVRSRVTTPDTILSPVRFVFVQDGEVSGVAAVWSETKSPPSAKRILLASGHFTAPVKSRGPNTFVTDLGQEWSVVQMTGGCGCNNRSSLLASIPLTQLTDPDFEPVG